MNIKLKNVRLSFPALAKAKAFKDEDSGNESEPYYSATFLLDKVKQKSQIKQLDDAVQQLLEDHFAGKKIPGAVKRPLRDGSEKDHIDGYGDTVKFISASTKKRPVIVDRSVNAVEGNEIEEMFYAGCYVNASLRLWVQDNKWGKRVNAQLRAVQFAKDGEAFGETAVNPEEEFESLDEDADDDMLG